MDENLIRLLDNIGLGTFIGLVVSVVMFSVPIIKYLKEKKNAAKDKIKNEVLKEEDEEKTKKDIETAISKIEGIDEKLDDHTNKIKEYVDERIGLIETQVKANTKYINHSKNEMENYRTRTEELLDIVKKTEENVKILIDSDKDTIYYIIMQTYRKCIDENEIDLSTLQNVERMYKKYIEEIEDVDDFIEKLMNEMRELPIKK